MKQKDIKKLMRDIKQMNCVVEFKELPDRMSEKEINISVTVSKSLCKGSEVAVILHSLGLQNEIGWEFNLIN